MPVFTIRTPRGDEIDIDAPDEATAVQGAQRWDHEDFATSEAKAAGLNPDLVLRQMRKESAGDQGAVSPKGARGLMQLMPDTARDLGVNPDDPYDNIRGGVRYLKQQMDDFGGDERLALAAYNAGPGNVRKYGGVPPFAETQDYVDTLAGKAPPAEGDMVEVGRSRSGGVSVEVPRAARNAEAAPEQERELEADQALGFLKGVTKPLESLTHINPLQVAADAIGLPGGEGYKAFQDQNAKLRSDFFAAQTAKGKRPGQIGEFAGNLVGTAWLPGGPMTSGAMSGAMLSEHDDPAGVVGDALVGAIGGKAGDLLLGGILKGLGKFGRAPTTMGAGELRTAKDAAYRAVDNEGVRYAGGGFKDLVAGITDELADLDPDVTPKAAAVLRNIQSRVGQEPTLSDLDKMRQYVRLTIGGKSADDAERRYASKIINNIDEFIAARFPRTVEGSGDRGAAAIKQARDLNARLKKVEAVETAVQEAEIRASKSGTGGNFENALRQELDKVRKKQPGLKADEKAALEAIIKGTKTQNMLRLAGRLSPTTGGLTAMLSTGAAGATGGASVPVSMGGYAAKFLADLRTKQEVDQLIKLFATGGKKADLERVLPRPVREAQRAVEKVRGVGSKASAVGAVRVTQ